MQPTGDRGGTLGPPGVVVAGGRRGGPGGGRFRLQRPWHTEMFRLRGAAVVL